MISIYLAQHTMAPTKKSSSSLIKVQKNPIPIHNNERNVAIGERLYAKFSSRVQERKRTLNQWPCIKTNCNGKEQLTNIDIDLNTINEINRKLEETETQQIQYGLNSHNKKIIVLWLNAEDPCCN